MKWISRAKRKKFAKCFWRIRVVSQDVARNEVNVSEMSELTLFASEVNFRKKIYEAYLANQGRKR